MSAEHLRQFSEALKASPALLAQAKTLASVDDFVQFGRRHGFEFSAEQFLAEVEGRGELSVSEIDEVTAGVVESIGTGFGSCPCSWQD